MPKLKTGLILLSFVSLLAGGLSMPAADAQQPLTGGVQSNNGNVQERNSTGSGEQISNTNAPTFKIPNFVGDRRQGDAHKYMHKTERDPWNDYRLELQQVAQQSFKQQPTQESPTPATAGPNQMISSTMAEAGIANAGLASNSMSGNGAAEQYAGGYSTGVSGSIQGQPSSQVPGLVGP